MFWELEKKNGKRTFNNWWTQSRYDLISIVTDNISYNNLLDQKWKELACSFKVCNLKDSGRPIKWNRNKKIMMSRYRNGLNGIPVPAKCSYTVTRKTIPNSYFAINTTCDYVLRCAKPHQASHSILSTKTKFILNSKCFSLTHQKLTACKTVINLKVCKHQESKFHWKRNKNRPHGRKWSEAMNAADPK